MTLRSTSGLLCTAAALALLTPAAHADLQRCRAIGDDRARLACYDALAAAPGPSRAAAPAPAAAPAAAPAVAGATPPAVAPAAAAAAEAGFGLASAPGTAQEVSSRLPGLFQGWDRTTRFTLANGQVWQVIDGSNAALALRDPVVRIRRAALGSFLMEVEGTNRTVRVRRVE